ncbi:uncharacterized protein LOC116687986 isoform X2 [Etheostoma spectabile]|uniref:uncharacterized protein LOC116687986 isoform X2 n=1 Tax=Etheostoma spectabile TaxID=54343 RepID=UPI0013AF289B|nr:uncharacterized protein LOC116687986 isoform X2 [Etheostoma spectabile]
MALSSLISQLQPEVFNSLVEIIKDVKKHSLQFYLHSPEPGDQVHEDVKKYLLKQGNMEQSPVTFLSQETSDNRLLVIIKNKDIAGHIHKIPGLVSLKRHASVVFVGIDTLDDMRNKSYNELFVSGGCIVSDELVLNPDFITHDRLAALLMILEQHSSPESVWKWKVHCKTHKKLKEQARFRRDAANLLNVLSTYHKRQIVEFLPYHQCDMMNHQSPDLDCLMELQARYTQYRHTVFLTEHHFEQFAAYSSSGIIMANIEELLHNFTRLVGNHEMKDSQPIVDDMLAPKEPIYPLPSSDQPQHLLQQSGSTLPAPSNLSDQLVPDASCKDGVPHHSDTDFEVLRLAISQLRAERQAQLQQQLDSQAELSINSLKCSPPNLVGTGSGHAAPVLAQGGPTESVNVTHDRKAMAASLEFLHSALQQERREDGAETPTEGRTIGGSQGEAGDQREGTPVRVVGFLGENRGPNDSDTSSPLSIQSTAAMMAPSTQTGSTNDRTEMVNPTEEPVFPKTDKHTAASSSNTARPEEGDVTRDEQSGQEQPRGEGAAPGNSTVSGTKTVSREGDGPDHHGPHPSSITCSQTEEGFPQLRSSAPTRTNGKQAGKRQRGNASGCTPQRLQLYNHVGEKFNYTTLKNPVSWKHITYYRPGWVPCHLPFFKPGNRYWELKANSTVVSSGMAPSYGKGPKRVACGVICYNHFEGPWCEVQSHNGDGVCFLTTRSAISHRL